MANCYVQTSVSIHPDHQMGEEEAANAISKFGVKEMCIPPVVQPRGEQFVHLVKAVDAHSQEVVETIAKRPDVAASPSPFRMSRMEPRGNVNENTPLRNGPGPLQMDAPGLSPIVHHQKKVVKDSSTETGAGTEMEGIAYKRTPLKDVGNTQGNTPPHYLHQQQYTGTPDKVEEDEKLLSMQMLDDTMSTPAKETRRRDSMDSSLETISVLVDHSVRTPLRGEAFPSRERARGTERESPEVMSMLKIREQGQQRVSSEKKLGALPPQPVSSGKMVVFGVEFDDRGTPVIVPLGKGAGEGAGEGEGAGAGSPPGFTLSSSSSSSSLEAPSGHKRGAGAGQGRQLFANSSQPASLPTPAYAPTVGHSAYPSKKPSSSALMSSSFWRDRLGRRTMSSVLSSPGLKVSF